MTVVEDLAATARAVAEDAAAAERTAEAEREKAAAALAKAEQRADEAETRAKQARAAGAQEMLRLLRSLTAGVRAAFTEAESAIETGGDVLGLWCKAQCLYADSRGKADAMSAEYERVTGQRAPKGDWGWSVGPRERVSPSVGRDSSVAGKRRGFDQWLTEATSRVVERRRAAVRNATAAALAATRPEG